MNTPTHILLALAVLDRPQHQAYLPTHPHSESAHFHSRWTCAIVIGALLPDLAMLAFYLWEKINGVPEAIIWGEHYYLPEWQTVFAAGNSIPFILCLLTVGLLLKWRTLWLLSLAMFLHVAGDLPLHHNDGHQHLWPFSDWVFVSPISYWDSQHGGDWFRWFEIMLALGLATWTFCRYVQNQPRYWGKWLILGLGLIYVSFIVYAIVIWA